MQDSDSNDKTHTYLQLVKDTVVGHYRILEKIGAGGMGEVYLAEDTKLNRKVALKFLPAHACQDAERRARFTREAQAAAKLDHPNIVAVHEVGEFNGRPFFSMQHVEGQTLKEFLSGKTVPLDRVIEIGIQICDGLQMAHEQGITHRDIKPTNILIDSRGRARMVDFGLASVLGFDKLTKTGSTLGTVGYMSPEQVRGDKLDHRTDLFSFGVVLYEMITGQSPFKSGSEAATLHAITNTKPELLARFRREIPPELQTIIDKALEKNVAIRYQHADEISADLRRLISTVSSGAIPVKRKRRVLVPSIALLVVVAALVVIFKPWRLVMKSTDEGQVRKRVVVVPFKNQTGDPSMDQLGFMAADWTTQGLILLEMVDVVPTEISRSLNAMSGIHSIAAATKSTFVVSGSYYRFGDSIQFQAQVNNAKEELLAAVAPVYASTAKPMQGVESVRQRVMGALAQVSQEGWEGQLSRAPKYDAWLQHIKGEELFQVKNDWAGAIPCYTQACALDSTFIAPLINMFWAYRNLDKFTQADSVLKILESRRSLMSAQQLLELDQQKAELAGDWSKELELWRRQSREFPQNANWFMIGLLAVKVNRPREAVEACKKVDRENVWAPFWIVFSEAYHLLSEHDKELETVREGRRRYPDRTEFLYGELGALAAMGNLAEAKAIAMNFSDNKAFVSGAATPAGSMRSAAIEMRAHGHEDEAMKLLDEAVRWYENQPPEKQKGLRGAYALTLYCARRWDKAKVIYEEFAQRNPRDSANGRGYAIRLGLIAARQGDRDKAMEVSEWLKSIKEPYQYGGLTYQRACIAAILGDKEQAVALLKESFLQGGQYGIELHRDFNLESLWKYPPFIEFLKPKG